MTKRPLYQSTCCTPVTQMAPTIASDLPIMPLRAEAVLTRASKTGKAAKTAERAGFKGWKTKHSHNIWSRNKVAKAMCAIRHAYAALVRRRNFTFDDIKPNRIGLPHEDPMGTLVGAMTLLKWNLNYQHLLEHNLNYETRRLCAASLFLTHKLKSEDGWEAGPGMPMSTTVLMEFLSRSDMFVHTWSKQKHDIFATELYLLKSAPVYSLTDENVQSETEMVLSRLLESGVINEEQADAALRRVFVYFYAASVLPDRDVFEDANISTGQMGRAMARTVLRGVTAELDELPLEVLAFSEMLVECLRVAHHASCVDNEFLKQVYEEEEKRVGGSVSVSCLWPRAV